jgi:ankyrin repeat protein
MALGASCISIVAQGQPAAAGQALQTIHQAAQAGDAATVNRLLEAEPTLVNAKDDSGRTPLHWACRGVHLRVVQMLVERGADVNALDRSGVAPLHSVASRGDHQAAALILARGARVDARMADQATPLHLAARNGHVDVARVLLERGGALEVRDATEDSPLHAAARADKWAVVDWLTGHVPAGQNAALSLRDFDGNTVLHLAGRSGRADTVTLLASKGIDLNARNAMGQTAYNLAEQAGFAAVAALLAGKGADRGPERFPRLSGPYLGQPPPGMTPQLFAKGIASTRQGVYGTIVFSLEHGEAFWHPEGDGVLFTRTEGGLWGPPRAFPFAARPSINVPFLSADDRRLYFMAGTRNSAGIVDREAIWFVERTSGGWSEPRSLDPIVNSVAMHWQFALDRDGNIYLSADGGIRRARFENGRYLAPELLPAPVNVPQKPEDRYRAGHVGPFVSPKGDYLIFTKFGSGIGLWVSFRQPDGSWGEPKNLSERLGGSGNDSAAQVTPDGRYLFFQSVRPGSAPSRSFYWVDASVIESLR